MTCEITEAKIFMQLDWSEQSPHIRTLFRPWQPGDGCDEAILQAVEVQLGIRLPSTLRNFYLAWGRQQEMTRFSHPLLKPEELEIQGDTLIFWVENQAVFYWGVQHAALKEADPEVVMTEPRQSDWEVESELNWKPSQTRLWGFLDAMTYLHALNGGALHGACTEIYAPALPTHHIAWLEEHWRKVTISLLAFHLLPGDPTDLTLYVRDGQAFCLYPIAQVLAAREAETIEELGQQFQIRWASQW